MTQFQTYFEQAPVGTFNFDETKDQLSFDYDPQWKQKGFPLSPHIPFDTPVTSETLKLFLENLLPEGTALRTLAQTIRVAPSNTLALVLAIGRETSGAFSFGFAPPTAEPKFIPVNEQELIERIAERRKKPIAIWNGKPRLSLAGYQQKLPLLVKQNEFGFGEGPLCSTHILKFSQDHNDHLVANESFCMQLAKDCGLQVPMTEIIDLGEPVLLVERFDREWIDANHIRRKHMIDACQALNISPSHKYERFLGDQEEVKDVLGPANLKNIYTQSEQTKTPAKTKMETLQWVLFNLLIGNSDAHAKNISYFLDSTGMELTPFYDLVSVVAHSDDVDHSLAFKIGETFELDKVDDIQLSMMAEEIDVSKSFLSRQIQAITQKMTVALDLPTLPAFMDQGDIDFIKDLKDQIEVRIDNFHSYAKKL
ncbi:MAG: hypothetical protein CL675_02090 [Bdellovibrionaceae bacterium]|nr:hypothetical protein [Pseudobdellovibrionaceae bacterium]